MPGVFVGSTEITDVGKIKVGSTDVQEIYVGATKIWPPDTGGLPLLFSWNPEAGEALPGSATFARASVAWYRNDVGVWVEAASQELRYHNLAQGGGQKGYLGESATTKLALFPRDLTNGAWSATNITPAKDATGIDAVTNSASTLTATATNGTIFQSFTRSSASHTFSCFVARKTGTGTVEITIDGGSTWTDITSSLTGNIDNRFFVTQTLANPSIGFRLGTSGDEIEVDMADLEQLAFYTTPLDHTSSTASRVRDALSGPIIANAPHSGQLDVTLPYDRGGLSPRGVAWDSNVNALQFPNDQRARLSGPDNLSVIIDDASSRLGQRQQFAYSTETNNGILVDNLGNSASDNSGGIPNGTLYIASSINAFDLNSVVHKYIAYDGAQTEQELKDLIGAP